ncbi:hypothetical protein E1A91_A02G122800v1 [Gossypium mustelinum]|uniref:Amino acid transporter transmembrane domain-containing protein n=1 Tax=Gossypium mustelinum TaxID=34275 RepID=A0A5D3A6M9_GOSMU|nr:hypothetical protein E1A91_A02G122800v1 [Gossypium mustelinum]
MSETGAGKNSLYNNQDFDLSIDVFSQISSKLLDDDGRPKRTAVTAAGVLSLAWATAQLGWIAGPVVMFMFSFITYYTSTLLAACYRSGDPLNGKRNYTYMDAVRSNLSGFEVKICGWVQYLNLFGVAIGYTIASSISMIWLYCLAIMIAFGIVEIFCSQIPDFDQQWWLSIVAAVMSFAYSTIGLGIGIAKVAAETRKIGGSLTGISVGTVTQTQKTWSFQALGDIAFAYSYSLILIEIQDTLKAPPSESKTMKKATLLSVGVTTFFYMLCRCTGYAAFGDLSPGKLLTGFGFYNPFWLLDIANAAIFIHLVGAYQVYCQPLFAFVEKTASEKFPDSKFTTKDIKISIPGFRPYNLNIFRLVWRTCFVMIPTLISMLLPFFNDIVGLLGALGFWPLTVYFPVEMYISQKKIPKWSTTWLCLQVLSIACFVITIAAAAGSIAGIVLDLKSYTSFSTGYQFIVHVRKM